jgi:hypothetical protein
LVDTVCFGTNIFHTRCFVLHATLCWVICYHTTTSICDIYFQVQWLSWVLTAILFILNTFAANKTDLVYCAQNYSQALQTGLHIITINNYSLVKLM